MLKNTYIQLKNRNKSNKPVTTILMKKCKCLEITNAIIDIKQLFTGRLVSKY